MPKMQMDDRKLKVLETLKALHHQTPRRYWFTVRDIAKAGHMNFDDAKAVIFGLAADGWLSLRDGDNDRQLVLIQLREQFRI